MKTYHLNPTMTLNTLSTPSTLDKPALRPHANTPVVLRAIPWDEESAVAVNSGG
jgi:hypothetical protein